MVTPKAEAGEHVDNARLRIMRKTFPPASDAMEIPNITVWNEDDVNVTDIHEAVQQKKLKTMLSVTANSCEILPFAFSLLPRNHF